MLIWFVCGVGLWWYRSELQGTAALWLASAMGILGIVAEEQKVIYKSGYIIPIKLIVIEMFNSVISGFHIALHILYQISMKQSMA